MLQRLPLLLADSLNLSFWKVKTHLHFDSMCVSAQLLYRLTSQTFPWPSLSVAQLKLIIVSAHACQIKYCLKQQQCLLFPEGHPKYSSFLWCPSKHILCLSLESLLITMTGLLGTWLFLLFFMESLPCPCETKWCRVNSVFSNYSTK